MIGLRIHSTQAEITLEYLFYSFSISLFGTVGIIIWSIQMMWTPIFAAGGINGAGHYWGYRNYNTNDDSTNMSPVGIIIGGEELHNNHHAYPTAAKFSLRPWEFDIGWMYIKLFGYIGLCRVKRLAPKPVIQNTQNTDSKLITQSCPIKVGCNYRLHTESSEANL